MRRFIAGLAPALIVIATSANAAAPEWRLSEVSGEVRLTERGQTRAAVKGALLSSGATITTGPRARAVIIRGEEFVVISPRSQLRVPAADSPNKIMQLIEDFGTAVFKINKKSTPHFGVQTPFLAAVVKGTTFTVTVGAEGSSVQVTEGAVEVSTLDGGASDLIEPGDIAMVGASDLYQLTVEGAETKVLRSDEAPAAGAVTAGVPAVAAAYAGPSAAAVRIEAPLRENPQSLSSLTDGLLEGGATMELAAVEFADQSRSLMVAPPDQAPGDKPTPNPGNGGGEPGDDDDKPGNGDDDDKPGNGGGDDKPGNGGKPGGDDDKPGNGGGKPGGDDDKPGNDGGKPGGGGDKPGNGGGDDDRPGNDDDGRDDDDDSGRDDDDDGGGRDDDDDDSGRDEDDDDSGRDDDDDDGRGDDDGDGRDDDDDDDSGRDDDGDRGDDDDDGRDDDDSGRGDDGDDGDDDDD